jgi:predicted TIM-barrel fold metal-dependent hydrolase
MSEQPPEATDLNVVVGPWPTDDHGAWSPQDAEGHLDRFGAARALVRHSVSIEYDAAEGNRRLLQEVRGHDRLVPAVVLGPLESGEHGDSDDLPDRLRCAGVGGVWLYPRRHGWSLHGPEADLLLRTLRRCGLPVLVELDELDWTGIDALAAAMPDTDIVVAGIGYRTLRQALPVLDRRPRVHVDLSYLAALDGLELLAARVGAHRVVLGTGAPVRDAAAPWFVLDRSPLPAADRALVAGGNAARLLGRPVVGRERPDVEDHPYEVIDAHGHIGSWPSSWLPHQGVDTLLEALRRTGTRHSVISHMAALWADTPGGNAVAIEAAEAHRDRLSVHLVVNPHRPQDEAVLREQLRRDVVRGIKVHPDTHDCPIDDRRYAWVWRLATEHRIPVLAHGFAGTGHSDPYLFGRVAERHADLTLLVGHSGATVEGFRRTIAVGREHPGVYAETCGSWMTGRWLARLVDVLGPERVVHGTDACLIDPRYGVGRVLGADLDAGARALVLGGNARRLFNLPDHLLSLPWQEHRHAPAGGH